MSETAPCHRTSASKPTLQHLTAVSTMKNQHSRRSFMQALGLGSATAALSSSAAHAQAPSSPASPPVIQGFEETTGDSSKRVWTPVSDRKVKVGIIGHGYCKFGTTFGFQNHPNVQIVAVSDLIPERCSELSRMVRCERTYPSLEELVKDKDVEAVFLATDAPSHARHTILALEHGKHVACAVPLSFGSLEEADQVFETVKKTGLKYMMFETSIYRADLWAMRQLHASGHLGKLVYTEGEYYHYSPYPIPSYKGWRDALPPQYYPTHSNAYHLGVNDGSFVEVSCMGMPSTQKEFSAGNNRYNNPYGTEIALFRSHDGGMSRMAVSWDTPGDHGERGRVRGDRGSYYDQFQGLNKKNLPDVAQPALPPGVPAGGHGGSHGRLTDEFISSILANRKPLVDVALSINMTVAGIVAHQSAMKDGELLKIPQYKMWAS